MQKMLYFCSVKHACKILFTLFVLLLGLSSCHHLPISGKILERRLHRQQHRADELTGYLVRAIESNNFDSLRTYAKADDNILFYIYRDMNLVYWSNAWLSSSDRVVRMVLDEWTYMQWDNAQGICHRKQVGDYLIVVAIPIKYNYKVTSTQLHNGFIPPFRGKEEWRLSYRQNRTTSMPIYSYDGSYLFSVDKSSGEAPLVDTSSNDYVSNNFSYKRLLDADNQEYLRARYRLYAFYILAFLTILVMLVISIYGLIKYRGARRVGLSGKFQMVLTPIVVIILSSISVLSLEHSRRVFVETQQLRLSKKAQYVQMMLQHMYFWDLTLSPANTMALNVDLRDMSFAFETDIHVYDMNGRLIGSSVPQLFDLGLLPRHIAPEAFFSGKEKLIAHEHISSVKYLSVYTEFINGNYTKIGYIALPSFISQKEMTEHLQDFLRKLVPLFVFLLLVSIVVVWGISYMITSSLRLVIEQLQQNKLSSHGKHINYPYQDEFGEMVEHYNQMMDVLAESTERLARTEREAAWRTMARQIAHEINNPLTPMKLTLQQLQRTKDTPRFEDYFNRSTQLLIEQIDNLGHIARSFSSFAKMPEVNPTAVDVAHKLSNFIALMRNNPSEIPIRYVGPDQGVMVLADAEQITQVFTNIVRNAMQAMEGRPNSDIIIILKGVSDTTCREKELNPQTDWIEISFSDNGPGIPEEMQDKVFIPNFTTKNTGAGLGMPISKNIVEGSGGKICFQTSEKGTTFFVYLRKK